MSISTISPITSRQNMFISSMTYERTSSGPYSPYLISSFTRDVLLGTQTYSRINIPANATWTQNGVTIAGGHGTGGATNQLWSPHGLFVDDDQTVVIADHWSHRIMQWKNGDTTNGQIVAGGKGQGNRLHQLKYPTDVLIDTETDSLIICDRGNRRVV
ncbi:unnamed protein product, partial [Rotaria socialis]